jgi:hypothetical protein
MERGPGAVALIRQKGATLSRFVVASSVREEAPAQPDGYVRTFRCPHQLLSHRLVQVVQRATWRLAITVHLWVCGGDQTLPLRTSMDWVGFGMRRWEGTKSGPGRPPASLPAPQPCCRVTTCRRYGLGGTDVQLGEVCCRCAPGSGCGSF